MAKMDDELAAMFGYVFDKLREAEQALDADDSPGADDARKLIGDASVGLDDIVIWLNEDDEQ